MSDRRPDPAHRAMIGGQHNHRVGTSDVFERLEKRGITEPRLHQGTERGLIGCHLLEQLRLGPTVHQHIEKVVNYRYERPLAQRRYLAGQILRLTGIEDFDVVRSWLEIDTHVGHLIIDELMLVPIETVLVVLSFVPDIAILFGNLVGKETAEDRIAGKRGGRRQ